MKLLIWDFDVTLAYREGQWSGALLDVLNTHVPSHAITRDQLRPYLRHGFPWHSPDQPQEPRIAADVWWARLMPGFVTAFTANGLPSDHAVTLAASVRAAYCNPCAWATYPETIAPSPRSGMRAGRTSSSQIMCQSYRISYAILASIGSL